MPVNLSGINDRSLLGRMLRAPLRLLPDGLCLLVLQGPLRGSKWIVGSSNHGCWLGSYEYEKQRLFARLVSDGAVVWDVGANVGFYTLLAARLAGRAGRVVAFEPLPENVSYLRRHLALNRVPNVDVLEVAVGDRVERAHFQPGDNRSTGSLREGPGDILVDVVSLDTLVAEGRVPPPDLIKMDIEGGEVAALRGARAVVSQSRPVLLLATHGLECHRECIRQLRSCGYRVEGVGGSDPEQTDELVATPL